MNIIIRPIDKEFRYRKEKIDLFITLEYFFDIFLLVMDIIENIELRYLFMI